MCAGGAGRPEDETVSWRGGRESERESAPADGVSALRKIESARMDAPPGALEYEWVGLRRMCSAGWPSFAYTEMSADGGAFPSCAKKPEKCRPPSPTPLKCMKIELLLTKKES